MIEKIYFDMDGVLADFDRGVRELCRIEPGNQSQNWDSGRDILLWGKVREVDHFSDKLEPMPGALTMFDMVYQAVGARCEILTGIPKPHRGIVSAAEDKKKWVRRLLSKEVVVNTVFREEKPEFCKGKGYVLIDDLDENIEDWERQGGTGILFTNALDALIAIGKLEPDVMKGLISM